MASLKEEMKTQAAYHKELKKWEEDRVLLSKVVQKEEDWGRT